MENKTIITCKRTFRHPVEKVFPAFMSPLQIKEWFGPREFTIGEVKLSPIAGGNLDIEMITPKGDSVWVKGTYTEIVPNERISYTFSYVPDTPNLGESKVDITFTPQASQTEVVLVHTVNKTIDPVGRAKGWETSLDKLEALLQDVPQ